MLNLSDLGPRSMNDTDICHLFVQLTASTNFDIISEKSIVLPFTHTKTKGTKFDLAIK